MSTKFFIKKEESPEQEVHIKREESPEVDMEDIPIFKKEESPEADVNNIPDPVGLGSPQDKLILNSQADNWTDVYLAGRRPDQINEDHVIYDNMRYLAIHPLILMRLIDHGMDVNLVADWPDQPGCRATPMNLAITLGSQGPEDDQTIFRALWTMNELLRRGATLDPDALYYAVHLRANNTRYRSHHPEVMRWLVDHGVDVNLAMDDIPFLHWAVYWGDIGLVTDMLDMGADPSARDPYLGTTAGQLARDHFLEDIATVIDEYLARAPPNEHLHISLRSRNVRRFAVGRWN